MNIQTRLAALAANWTARLILAAIILVGVAWFWNSWITGQAAKTDARLKENQVEAAVSSGQDAVGTLGGVMAGEDKTDMITRENNDEIRNAEGADAPVDPAVRNAGLRGLCRRAAYRERDECLQFTASP